MVFLCTKKWCTADYRNNKKDIKNSLSIYWVLSAAHYNFFNIYLYKYHIFHGMQKNPQKAKRHPTTTTTNKQTYCTINVEKCILN